MADPRKRTWWKHEPFFLNVSWETWAKNNCYIFPYVYRNDFIMFFLGVCACPQRGNAPLMTKKGSFHHIFLQITLVKHWIETLLMFLSTYVFKKINIGKTFRMFIQCFFPGIGNPRMVSPLWRKVCVVLGCPTFPEVDCVSSVSLNQPAERQWARSRESKCNSEFLSTR